MVVHFQKRDKADIENNYQHYQDYFSITSQF